MFLIPAILLAASVNSASEPSFSCAAAHTETEKWICANADLGALDRELAQVYKSAARQPGGHDDSLDRDEKHWLHDVRDACRSTDCIADAYAKRIAELRGGTQSALATPPAAEIDTFASDPALLTEARSYIGKHCKLNLPNEATPGFKNVPGFLPVVFSKGYVHARTKGDARFAFLLMTHDDEASTCWIGDVVALPSANQANAFLYCDGEGVASPGVGMRLAGEKKLVGYWFIDEKTAKLVRVPSDKLAASSSMLCSEPESGD